MIIVDTALKARAAAGKPVRVGMIGAGFMAQGIANQIINSTPGMTLVAISNRTIDKAIRAFVDHGAATPVTCSNLSALNAAISADKPAVTEDPILLCQAGMIDAIIDVTGAVELGAQTTMEAIKHKKHVILMNAEVDGTIGPILRIKADKAGVIVSGCDGDQPGVQMNLYRFVKQIGLTPLVCGNIKGLHDPYRNPTTQKGFAEKWGQNPAMVTSFADGSKISFEQAIVANATGMTVARRAMLGYEFDGHVDEATKLYDIDQLKAAGGIVDYLVKTRPGPGVFVFATHDDPRQRHYLNLYKLGPGPLYSFYTPYHLCHFEAPSSIARAVLLNDAVMQPMAPRVDVITIAKTPLKAGTTLDGIGHYMTYGVCEKADITLEQNLLPIGLAEGCRLKRDVEKDEAIGYDDVEVPAGRLVDSLRDEQNRHFADVLRPAAVSA